MDHKGLSTQTLCPSPTSNAPIHPCASAYQYVLQPKKPLNLRLPFFNATQSSQLHHYLDNVLSYRCKRHSGKTTEVLKIMIKCQIADHLTFLQLNIFSKPGHSPRYKVIHPKTVQSLNADSSQEPCNKGEGVNT